jgi:hypothetical protein
VTGDCRPEAEQFVASAEGAGEATSNPEQGEVACHPTRRLDLFIGIGGNGRNSTATNLEMAVNFSPCMRNQGGRDFPDPSADESHIDMPRSPSAAGSSTRSMRRFRAAADRCTAFYPSTLGLQGK